MMSSVKKRYFLYRAVYRGRGSRPQQKLFFGTSLGKNAHEWVIDGHVHSARSFKFMSVTPTVLIFKTCLRITNLEDHFTKAPHSWGIICLDRGGPAAGCAAEVFTYAMYELVVRGSFFCYGHASECFPVPGVKHQREHGTLAEVYVMTVSTTPWAANCEDLQTLLLSGPNKRYQRPSRNAFVKLQFIAVHSCDCDPVGSVEGGVCDRYTDLDLRMISGQCRCKPNVRGQRCDYCKDGHYGLSQNDPLGCQPCNCDPRGITMLGAPCDPISGDCSCKRYVTGRYCSECIPEYWGLSNDLSGCRPCDCDFGGAYSNKCRMDNGQCDCRPHLIGRQCSDVQPQYFCAALDYNTYEAEGAQGHSPDDRALPGSPRPQAVNNCAEQLNNQLRRHKRHRRIAQQQRAALRRIRQLQQTPDVMTVHRERQPGQMVTWTGPGFARVKDGAGLVFTIDNIVYAMEYDIMIRYEPESTEDWEAIVSITSVQLPTSPRCGNLLPTEQLYIVILPHHKRINRISGSVPGALQFTPSGYIQMPRPFCFEPNNRYVVSIRFQRHAVSYRHLTAYILVDSLVLMPKYEELPGFQGNDPLVQQRREEMVRYMCVESFMVAPMPPLAEMCIKLICSISSVIHDGALPCRCDQQGSLSAECDKVGGQCRCKPNVIGRNCDQCAPRTYGFGPHGCTACDCHLDGSVGQQCDPSTGQCPCRAGARGRQCSDCQPGHWGFPNCKPCHCNGHADSCDPHTGLCHECRDHTAGHLCERCMNGFYGNPVLGSGEHCRPCPCPGNPGSHHSNGDSCYMDPASNQIICHCKLGYTGPRCDQCAPGYYGNPEQAGGWCRQCECNGNTVAEDPDSCDSRTGQCLKCLYNTDGPSCSECKPGYYGNALARDCRRCTCMTLGTQQEHCNDGLCYCDRQTGACPCRANVEGHNCDQCAPNHWNLGMDQGCEACRCHPQNSLGSHCNLLTGQCYCKPGFGGPQCTECEPLHWGNPNVQCEECRCDPLGADTLQCNRITGECVCREGASGRHCGECARGFYGNFPKCVACHPCFELWNDTVYHIQCQVDDIQNFTAMFLESGETPSFSNARIRELEKKLAEVQDLLKSEDREKMYQKISQALDDLRAEIAVTDGRVMGIAREMNGTAEQDNVLKRNLTSMEQELRDLNDTLAQLRRDLNNYLTAGLGAQLDEIHKYYQQSLDAEKRCNASVYGPESPVEQSQDTRNVTETLLKQKKDQLLRTVTAHNKSLSELDKKVNHLDHRVNRLSHRVCGGNHNVSGNDTCPDNSCGGIGCKDGNGTLLCGGPNCNGTVGTSLRALQEADLVTKNLTAASDDLMNIAKKLQDIATLTQNVKTQAMNTLDKAQKKKALFEKSNKELKNFIQQIRDFLTAEGADPESIEKVALQVLAIQLPVNQTLLDRVVEQIKDNIANLTDVEKVFNQTSVHLAKANELLNRAQNAKTQADAVSDAISETKQAMNTSEEAIQKAEKAIEMAMEHLKTTQNATAMVDDKLTDLEKSLMNVMSRLANLSQGVEMLKNKTEQNRQQAQKAKALADNATQAASELSKEMSEAESRYKELRDKVDSLGGAGAGNVTQKAIDMKNEAEGLLKKANKDMETLKKLEKKFQENEQKIQDQRDEIEQLEKNATEVREIIRTKVTAYNNCQ
ncbi:hypothetical protein NFI96_018366 [Prochilodus magdalenae]|nr:hypothetical protein NFI96_018366 [Prochilodus magdalenae]